MPLIGKPADAPFDPTGNINIPAMEVPSFRYLLAKERGTVKDVLIMSPFALGDCVCAEPAIRFAAKNFADCEVTLLTPFPQLYSHIENLIVLNQNLYKPNWDDYFVLKCYYAADELQSEFMHNFNMAIPDYIATCLFKGQVPVQDRNIVLKPVLNELSLVMHPKRQVVIHPGRHWVTKTFPKDWWDEVISEFILNRVQPTLIGANLDDNKRGTVDVNATGCMDLRDKLSIMESVELLQHASVVLTNDSAPLHMAASGNAWIGFFSTVRHPDFTMHWRPTPMGENQFGYKMQDLAKGCIYQTTDVSPARNGAKYDVIDQPTLRSWLPDPADVVKWALDRLAFASN